MQAIPTGSRLSPTSTVTDSPSRQDLSAEEVHRRRADEARDEQVRRLVVELLRPVDLLEHAHAHDRDAVAHRHGLDLVVRDVDRRRAELVLELRDLGPHLDSQLGVEVRERLVHEEDLRVADDRPAHRDPLLLASRKLPGLAREIRRQVEELRRPRDPVVDVLLRGLPQPQAERDVVRDRQVRVERVVLEDHRDVAILRREVVHDALPDRDRPVADLLEARDHAQRGRLAAARRSDEDEELAVLDVEREVLHGVDPSVVELVHLFQLNVGHSRYPFLT